MSLFLSRRHNKAVPPPTAESAVEEPKPVEETKVEAPEPEAPKVKKTKKVE